MRVGGRRSEWSGNDTRTTPFLLGHRTASISSDYS